MKTQDFLRFFIEELELEQEEITLQTHFKELEEWDSVTALMLIGFVSNQYGLKLTAEDIESLTTVQSILDRIS
ncbi:acyl carrier protein [Schleiferiaceae bacterium]|nr:acyl carrier protein [Schleiferiaceae bacterium]